MKTKFLLLLFCWVSLTVYGQKEERPHGADFYHNDYDLSDEDFLKLPWVGDYDNLLRAIQEKQYLLDLYTNNRNTDCDYLFDGEDLSNDPIVFVPVYFYVYRAPSNDPIVPTEAEVRALTDYTNTLLANSGSQIRLSIACIQFPIEADYVIIQDSDELDDMMQEYVDGPGLNVHIVNIGYGWSGIYNTDQDGLALIRGEVVNDPTETLAHELGHFFSLPHTHRATNLDISAANGDGFNVPCFREAVSRNLVFDFGCFNWPWGLPFSHCSWTGDGFCDTPADPNGDSCNYNEDWVDFRGEAFVPDEDNIMSYYDCTSSFSPMQVNAMWNNLLNRLAGSWSDILNGDFVVSDSYEPNNDEDEAGLIAVGETQIHTLHDNCITDEDWFAIEPGQALGDYIIHVEKLPDCDWPVDDVDVLYKNFLGNMVNFIPASVVPLNGKFYITIDCQEVANEELFIRVENNSKPEGAYKIYMESSEGNASIDGPEVICQNQSYEVIDIPSGASVTWSATPGLNLSCLSCNPTTIQSVGGASTYTIEALVSDNGCDIKLEQELTNSATIIPPFFIEEIIPACYDALAGFGFSEYTISNPTAGITYNWTISGGSIFPGTGIYATVNPNSIGSFTITVTANGPCNSQRVVSSTFFAEECDDMRLKVSPNPARDMLRVEIDDTVAAGSVRDNYLVFINDLYGEMVYQGTHEVRVFDLNVSTYKEGVYNITIFRGDVYTSTNFIVNKGQ